MANYVLSCAVIVYIVLNFILGVTDCLDTNKTRHVCVIGAGYSGLGTARYLKQNGVDFTVYEATRHIGGTWRFDPHVGTDEDGLPLFTSMYKYLRTNTPRQTMEYPGFPFPDSTPSFPTGTCFYKYLKSFAKHYDLNKYIQFRSFVISVKWANGNWNLTYRSTVDNNTYTASCDFVVIANGFYSNPKFPHFPGQELFKGSIIHSHDYKEPEVYKDRRVLLLGAGPSGLDLATQLVNFTSKLVHSHHLVYNQPNFPKNYIKKPDIDSFTSNGVVFNDGSFEEVDDIIFCTGYNYNHPFLDKSSGVTATREFLLPLYQDVINIRHPSMAFVGKSKGVINRIIDVQSEYAAALAADKFKLPRPEEMLRIWLDRVHELQTQKKKIVDVNLIGKDMYNYCANLTQEAGVTRFPPVIQEIRDFNLVNRLEDLLNYRDYDFEIINEKQFDRYYNPGRQDVCPISV